MFAFAYVTTSVLPSTPGPAGRGSPPHSGSEEEAGHMSRLPYRRGSSSGKTPTAALGFGGTSIFVFKIFKMSDTSLQAPGSLAVTLLHAAGANISCSRTHPSAHPCISSLHSHSLVSSFHLLASPSHGTRTLKFRASLQEHDMFMCDFAHCQPAVPVTGSVSCVYAVVHYKRLHVCV
jgi:hypothetical protein